MGSCRVSVRCRVGKAQGCIMNQEAEQAWEEKVRMARRGLEQRKHIPHSTHPYEASDPTIASRNRNS